MRITSKGQKTIPVEIRELAGLLPHTEVEFEFDGEAVRIVRVTSRDENSRGARGAAACGRGRTSPDRSWPAPAPRRALARLIAHLRGRGDVAMSTDEIMALTSAD